MLEFLYRIYDKSFLYFNRGMDKRSSYHDNFIEILSKHRGWNEKCLGTTPGPCHRMDGKAVKWYYIISKKEVPSYIMRDINSDVFNMLFKADII